MTQTAELTEHKRLKEIVKAIGKTCNFNIDSEIHLNFSGQKNMADQYTDEESIDVALWSEIKGKRFLFIFECKGGKKLDGVNNEISLWEASLGKFKNKTT